MTQQSEADEPIHDTQFESDSGVGDNVKAPSRTPFFEASHAPRYHRQQLIREIQDRTKHLLICYVSGGECSIDEDDTVPFVDLLHNVPTGRDVDLLLHTGGGSVDAADKLMRLVRSKVGSASLRIIVPDFAKAPAL